MLVRQAERVVVQTEEYNQWHFEIVVELNHFDLGITNEELATLPENEWEELYGGLKERVRDEVHTEVMSFFERVQEVSRTENLATRSIRHADSQTRRRRR